MSAPEWLKDIAPAPQPTPAGPLAKPADLAPVARPKKEPRSPLNRRSSRQPEKKARQFGEQAQRCREAPCACCSLKGFSVPHHWPTVAAGGLDQDTLPLCDGFGSRFCHDAFHKAGSPRAFLESHGCDVLAGIKAMRRKPDHSCERLAVLREDPKTLRSHYVCDRCGKVLPDEQQGGDA